jgi:hypothetical protein|tara:strand:- start:7962 stop:8666 length:705 start_codon:yes stop_codon:yes gene_type:complete
MKKIKLLSIGILSVLLFLMSCGKDDDTSPQNKSAVTGVYTGVLVGSTGAYELNLAENGVNSSVLFDGTTYSLSSNETLENGQSLTLTDGTISLVITVDNNGENPSVSFTIPGHNIQATVILSNSTNPNRNYIGWTENFRNGVKVYRTTTNLTLHNGNQWTGIERVDVDIDPNNPNHQSDEGEVNNVNGTYTEDTNGVTFKLNGNTLFTLNKIGNKLTLFESGTTTFEVELTKVN